MEFFDEISKITGKKLPDPSALSQEDKAVIALHLKNNGESALAISNYLGCTRQWVYKLIKKALEEDLNELECRTYMDEYLSTIRSLEMEIDRYKKAQEQLRKGYKTQELTKDGELVELNKKGSPRDFKEYGAIIQKYQQMLIDLKLRIGMLPSKERGDLYTVIGDMNPEYNKDDRELLDKNSDEVISMLLQKLTQKRPSLKENAINALKSVKDQKLV